MDSLPTGFLIHGAYIGSEVRQMRDGPGLVLAVSSGVNSYQVNMAQVYDTSKLKFGDMICISCRPMVTQKGNLWITDGRLV